MHLLAITGTRLLAITSLTSCWPKSVGLFRCCASIWQLHSTYQMQPRI
jgi:hypothetical protein